MNCRQPRAKRAEWTYRGHRKDLEKIPTLRLAAFAMTSVVQGDDLVVLGQRIDNSRKAPLLLDIGGVAIDEDLRY